MKKEIAENDAFNVFGAFDMIANNNKFITQ